MKWIVFTLVAFSACSAQAAVIHIKPSLVTVFDSAFNDVTSTAVDFNANGKVRLRPSVEPYTMQVNFTFTIADLREGQLGFGNAAFNIDLARDLIQSTVVPGWQPDIDLSENNGFPPGGFWNKWADNGDYGIAGDLHGIVVGTDPPDFGPIGVDPRREFGQHGDEFFGNVYVELSGTHGTVGSFSVEGDGGSYYNANNKLVDAGVTVTGGAIDFLVGVPEPSSFVLLGLGGVLLAGFVATIRGRDRRIFDH